MMKRALKLDAHAKDAPRSRRRWGTVWLVVLLFGFGQVPSVWAFNCLGQVGQIKKWPNSVTSGNGFIGVRLDFADGTRRNWLLCSTRPDLHNPDSTIEDCNHVLSLLAIAKGLGSNVLLTFNATATIPNSAGGTGATTCQEIAEWNAAVIPHVAMVTVE